MLTSYESWANNESSNSAVIVYDSMWHSTEIIAHTICEAFEMKQINYQLFDLKKTHIYLIVPEILTCKYIAVGSHTLNNQMMPSVAGFLCYLKGLSPKNKKAFAFGSYGWGGQSISLIEDELNACNFEIIMEGIKTNYIPSEKQLLEIKATIQSKI